MKQSNYKNPCSTLAWNKLLAHYHTIGNTHMRALFENNPNRVEEFTASMEGILLDYSKNRINATTKKLLIDFAKEMNLTQAIRCCFDGDKFNLTENRAVLHTALRTQKEEVLLDGVNIIPSINKEKAKMKSFTQGILNKIIRGATGKAFTDVVNIGIGGSDLGPKTVVNALKQYRTGLKIHYVSNIDFEYNHHLFQSLNPETTLFIVVSKSFTTKETITNATLAKAWLTNALETDAIAAHFVAVSANEEAVQNFGIAQHQRFAMWDWVGGRFSLWSAVGLSIALGLGYDNYERLLEGARTIDDHFESTALEDNIPVIMALLNIWYTNFFDFRAKAIIPYKESLRDFIDYLEQGFMESNGKMIDKNGQKVSYNTGNLIFGNTGVNSQHAFFQLFHQGTLTIPTDFIGFCNPSLDKNNVHNQLMANMFAQSKALMLGEENKNLFNYFEGNKPSNTLLFDRLTPHALGQLIAIYEHVILVEGILLNINSFDQFGVELGKKISAEIEHDLAKNSVTNHDASTNNLLQYYLNKKQ